MSITKVGLVSLGCAKNRVDSENLLGMLAQRGMEIVADPAEADVIFVNTCGFIESAKEESIEAIFDMAQYKKSGRLQKLFVTGCLAQRYPDALMDEIPEIDGIMGVADYARLSQMLADAADGQRPCYIQNGARFLHTPRILTTPGYSAFVKISDGCDNRCTYCAIPLIRGPYRSRPLADVLGEVRRFAEQGVKEHILIAQDTTRYGTDWQETSLLPELMDQAAGIPGVEWLRVLYAYPDEADDRLLEVMASHDNICKYLDLPIQLIDDGLLRRMNRRGTAADIRRILKKARDMGFTLRTSLIVGFPGETEEQFQELMDFVAEARFDRMGAFAFSPEENTPAAEMPDQIPEEVKQERLDRLMQLQACISLENNQARIGTVEKVLVTDARDGLFLGRSQREAPDADGAIVFTAKEAPEVGSFVQVHITGAETYDLKGERL